MKHFKLLETLELEKFFYDAVVSKLSNYSKGNQNGSGNGNDNQVEMIRMIMSNLFSKYSNLLFYSL